MDNEMIERVIKASFDTWNKHRGLNFTVNDMSEDEKEFAREHAIAIIKAMREPTDKMLAIYNEFGHLDIEAYQSMIDAVLND